MGVVLLVLIAFGVFLSPDLRSNPVAVGLAILTLLGALGLVLRWRQRIAADQAMIDLERRSRH